MVWDKLRFKLWTPRSYRAAMAIRGSTAGVRIGMYPRTLERYEVSTLLKQMRVLRIQFSESGFGLNSHRRLCLQLQGNHTIRDMVLDMTGEFRINYDAKEYADKQFRALIKTVKDRDGRVVLERNGKVTEV